jgi:hypothetical protein
MNITQPAELLVVDDVRTSSCFSELPHSFVPLDTLFVVQFQCHDVCNESAYKCLIFDMEGSSQTERQREAIFLQKIKTVLLCVTFTEILKILPTSITSK